MTHKKGIKMKLYEILSLIITGLGVVATFAAVIVALWQTKFVNKKKLKCGFVEGNELFNIYTDEHKLYVSMDIINIGNKKVVLEAWGIKTNDHWNQILTSWPKEDYFDKCVSVETPYTLEPECRVSFSYDKELFLKFISQKIKENEMDANKKILFFIKDSTGRIYKIKSKKKASEYLEKKSENNKKKLNKKTSK